MNSNDAQQSVKQKHYTILFPNSSQPTKNKRFSNPLYDMRDGVNMFIWASTSSNQWHYFTLDNLKLSAKTCTHKRIDKNTDVMRAISRPILQTQNFLHLDASLCTTFLSQTLKVQLMHANRRPRLRRVRIFIQYSRFETQESEGREQSVVW